MTSPNAIQEPSALCRMSLRMPGLQVIENSTGFNSCQLIKSCDKENRDKAVSVIHRFNNIIKDSHSFHFLL